MLNVSGVADGGSFMVGIYTDNLTTPGTLINATTVADGSGVALPSPSVSQIVTADFGSTALTADTRFWIGLSSPTGGSSEMWNWSLDLTGPDVAPEYFANINGVMANSGVPGIPFTGGGYQMRLFVLPEPPSIAWLGLGALPLLLRRRRK